MHKEGLHLDLFINMHLQHSARMLTALCMSSSKSKGFRSISSSGASGLCNALSDISRATGVSSVIRASNRLFALQTEARLCADTCVQAQAVCLPRPCRVCFEPSSQRPIQVPVISRRFSQHGSCSPQPQSQARRWSCWCERRNMGTLVCKRSAADGKICAYG